MAHLRSRLAKTLLLKRLKHSPVVAIQGARQTGKSTLARKLLKTELPGMQSVSLDLLSEQQLAQTAPQTFLARFKGAHPMIIDEAQKAPALFDAIKFQVDEQRAPGQFLLLGSTEFSHFQNIRESLTGRMGRVRLYPLIARELLGAQDQPIDRSFMLKYAECGGMPAICFVRDSQARSDLIQDWIDLTCNRDVHQFKRVKVDSDLAYSILRECAIQEQPTQANIARVLKTDGRKIGTHLKVLCELFVLLKLDSHPSGAGKSLFLPLDAGIAHYLGAGFERRLHIILVNEKMAHNAYFGKKRNRYYYYRSTGKHLIHLIEEDLDEGLCAFQILETERVKLPDLERLKAFRKKHKDSKCKLFAPIFDRWKDAGVEVDSWERMTGL
ncbi:AAA family ATPase [Bdellovibrionota bacterium FG-2]